MNQFSYNGRICLINNAAGRALRGIALGRKAWLFAGSDAASALRSSTRSLAPPSSTTSTRIYDRHPRELCPIILGHTNGQEIALTCQFAGRAASRCHPAANGNASTSPRSATFSFAMGPGMLATGIGSAKPVLRSSISMPTRTAPTSLAAALDQTGPYQPHSAALAGCLRWPEVLALRGIQPLALSQLVSR